MFDFNDGNNYVHQLFDQREISIGIRSLQTHRYHLFIIKVSQIVSIKYNALTSKTVYNTKRCRKIILQ